jgi:hypothetical protein
MKFLSVKLGLILFVIGLTIFGNVEVCSGQCAWVLWLKDHNEKWEIQSAFPTYNDCQEAQRNLFLHFRNTWKNAKAFNEVPIKEAKITEVQFSWMSVWLELQTGRNVSIGTFELKCLPDTLDLRK